MSAHSRMFGHYSIKIFGRKITASIVSCHRQQHSTDTLLVETASSQCKLSSVFLLSCWSEVRAEMLAHVRCKQLRLLQSGKVTSCRQSMKWHISSSKWTDAILWRQERFRPHGPLSKVLHCFRLYCFSTQFLG